MRKTILQYECCKSMLTAKMFVKNYNKTLTKETIVWYIGTMFKQAEQGTKNPEASP